MKKRVLSCVLAFLLLVLPCSFVLQEPTKATANAQDFADFYARDEYVVDLPFFYDVSFVPYDDTVQYIFNSRNYSIVYDANNIYIQKGQARQRLTATKTQYNSFFTGYSIVDLANPYNPMQHTLPSNMWCTLLSGFSNQYVPYGLNVSTLLYSVNTGGYAVRFTIQLYVVPSTYSGDVNDVIPAEAVEYCRVYVEFPLARWCFYAYGGIINYNNIQIQGNITVGFIPAVGWTFAGGAISYKADEYTNAYNNGYQLGNDAGYYNGYNEGFYDGVESVLDGNDEYTFMGLISAVVDAPVKALAGLFNFNVLGIDMFPFLTAILTMCIIIAVVKMVM